MKNKKMKPLVILSIMVLVLISIGVTFYARESSKKLTNTNSEKVFEKSDAKSEKNEEVIDSKNEDDDTSKLQTETKDNLKEEKKETTEKSSQSSSNTTTSKTNKSSNSSTSSNSNQSSNNNTTTSTTPKSEPKQEVQEQPQTTAPSNNTSSNNDSKEVDTNSFFYSIHRGTINTKTQSGCLGAGEEIAFLDTVDINYYRCYEVTAKDGSILGYYLNIFCNSDNCNRYKSQIDWSKYN